MRVSADIYSSLLEQPTAMKDIKHDAKELALRINEVIAKFMAEKGYK